MEISNKQDIRSLSKEKLGEYFAEIGQPKFRVDQVHEWLWIRAAKDFDQMTNLPLSLREGMKNDFVINHIHVDEMQRSTDGTIKNAVKLFDGNVVESVLIPTEKRITACISSQVGCSLDCAFCATARLKRMRNLNADEIYDQVAAIKQQSEEFFSRPLTNIVFMGMGEPLLNYNNVLEAIDKISSEKGLGIAPKRITLSTVGLPKMIVKLADEDVKFNLAVSLHSAINEKRSSIMPINDVSPLEELAQSLQYWYKKTRRKVTFEYVVWKGINDRPEDAEALALFCRKVPSKVNLIEYNSIDDPRFLQADPEALQLYIDRLAQDGVVAKVRISRGKDVDAACGQLANKNTAITAQ
jgi:23S rRNA (adenine2503-C2)-methyltransferase